MKKVKFTKTAFVVVESTDVWQELKLEQFSGYESPPVLVFTVEELKTFHQNMLDDPNIYTKTDFIKELVKFFDHMNFIGSIIFQQGW